MAGFFMEQVTITSAIMPFDVDVTKYKIVCLE